VRAFAHCRPCFAAHTHTFLQSFIIRGSLAELGLDTLAPRLCATDNLHSVSTASAGYKDSGAMLRDLSARCPRCFNVSASDTRVLCHSTASVAFVNGYAWDRIPRTECSRPSFEIRHGDEFTLISVRRCDESRDQPAYRELATCLPPATCMSAACVPAALISQLVSYDSIHAVTQFFGPHPYPFPTYSTNSRSPGALWRRT
jgi:hypothetical protein